jgi:outer membrane lipoprotein SlyB
MLQKSIMSFLGALVLFQLGCSNSLDQYQGTTFYDPEVLGQPMRFAKGTIVSAHDVQIKWKNSKNRPNQVVGIASTATEFVIKQDVGGPLLIVQINEDQLRVGERVLLLNDTGKTRIVRDRVTN